MILFLVITIISGVFSSDKINVIQTTRNETFEDKLKKEYGCEPLDQFKLIKQSSNDGFVENVCLPSTYQVNKPPHIPTHYPVAVMFHEKKVLEINERRKSITLLIELYLFWEDPRIRNNASGNSRDFYLPPIKTAEPYIWVPIMYPYVANVRKITDVHGPAVPIVGLSKGKVINEALSMELFSQNATIMLAGPMWKIEVFCEFDFSKYPFDHQTCSLYIGTYNLNITICDGNSWAYIRLRQSDFGGYDLNQTIFKIGPGYDPITNANYENFGFHISMTRQIETYVYQYYLPCMAVVITSVFSFIVPLTAIPGRVMIVVTQFLTLTNIFSNAMVSNLNRIF